MSATGRMAENGRGARSSIKLSSSQQDGDFDWSKGTSRGMRGDGFFRAGIVMSAIQV